MEKFEQKTEIEAKIAKIERAKHGLPETATEERSTASRSVSERIDEQGLAQAIKMGILNEKADIADLTIHVRQTIIDNFTLRDAIEGGFVEKGSTIEDLTNGIRNKMLLAEKLKKYRIDGSINLDKD